MKRKLVIMSILSTFTFALSFALSYGVLSIKSKALDLGIVLKDGWSHFLHLVYDKTIPAMFKAIVHGSLNLHAPASKMGLTILFGIWIITTLILAFLLFVKASPDKIMGVRSGENQKNISGDGEKGSARWLNGESEMLKVLPHWIYKSGVIIKNKAGGLILGIHIKSKKKELVFHETDDYHALIIGTTRSGKGRVVIAQSIWNIGMSGESMILTDPKGELFKMAAPYLRSKGYDIHLINLDDLTRSDRWNAMYYVNKAIDEGNVDEAVQRAKALAQVLCASGLKSNSDPLWYQSAVATIQSLVLYVSCEARKESERHMGSVYRLLLDKGSRYIQKTSPMERDRTELEVMYAALPSHHPALMPFALKKLAGGNTEASINTSTAGYLQLFNNDPAIRVTSYQSFTFEDIGNKPVAVFIRISPEETTYYDLACLFIEQSYSALIKLANKNGGRLPNRVNYILDEFGNLPPLPDFAKKLTISASFGIRFNVAVQGLDQIKQNYRDDATTIEGNCQNTIYLLSSDLTTNKNISDKLGAYTRLIKSASQSVDMRNTFGGEKPQVNINYSHEQRSLMTPDELSKLKYGTGVLLRLRSHPALLTLPDLADCSANRDFGLAHKTKDVSRDKEINRKILMEREAEIERFRYTPEPIIYITDEDEPASPQRGEDSSMPEYPSSIFGDEEKEGEAPDETDQEDGESEGATSETNVDAIKSLF